jgi:hypothetical protein
VDDPRAAQDLEDALEVLLRHAAWSGGSLNKNGTPVELAFTAGDPTTRFTIEVDGADTPPAARLRLAALALAELGCSPPDIMPYRNLQGAGGLTWGAWVGVRQPPAGALRYKLYVEVPPGAATPPDCPPPPERLGRLAAVGVEEGRPEREFYFVGAGLGLSYADLTTLLRPLGLEGQRGELWGAMQQARRSARRDPLPPACTYGYSYRVGTAGAPAVFSLFGFPTAWIGSDRDVRRVLLELAGAGLAAYGRVSALLRDGPLSPHHNALGWVVAEGQAARLHIAMSPPS